jgi:hypothetical protein
MSEHPTGDGSSWTSPPSTPTAPRRPAATADAHCAAPAWDTASRSSADPPPRPTGSTATHPGHRECLRAAVALCSYIAIGRARHATARRLQPGTVTPPGFADTEPAEWLLGITRNYRMLHRRGTLVFRPAPFTGIER